MKLIRGLYNLTHPLTASAVTIGNFDGVHRGHQLVINQLQQVAATAALPTVVIIFEPQPMMPAEQVSGEDGGLFELQTTVQVMETQYPALLATAKAIEAACAATPTIDWLCRPCKTAAECRRSEGWTCRNCYEGAGYRCVRLAFANSDCHRCRTGYR